jgi:hypothetical protein
MPYIIINMPLLYGAHPGIRLCFVILTCLTHFLVLMTSVYGKRRDSAMKLLDGRRKLTRDFRKFDECLQSGLGKPLSA